MQRPPRASPALTGGANGGMTRAERFEDERRRIIESCFSKADESGSRMSSSSSPEANCRGRNFTLLTGP